MALPLGRPFPYRTSRARNEPPLEHLTASQDASPPAYATDHQSLYASTASQHSRPPPSSDDGATDITFEALATNDPQDHPNDHTRTGQDSHTDHHQAKSPDTYNHPARTRPHESATNSTEGPQTATTLDDKPQALLRIKENHPPQHRSAQEDDHDVPSEGIEPSSPKAAHFECAVFPYFTNRGDPALKRAGNLDGERQPQSNVRAALPPRPQHRGLIPSRR